MSTQKFRTRAFPFVAGAALFASLFTPSASASPVLLAGAGSEKVHSTSLTLMQKDGMSVISVLPDYQGPLRNFAVIIPVPKDVTKEQVITLKREYTDRVALVSAPKYAEFWEMDPCDSEKLEQEWERDLTVSSDTAFLGSVKTDPSKKVAKEMLLDVEAKQKEGEYTETVVGSADEIKAWLGKKDYTLPDGGEASLTDFEKQGYKFLALDVDVNRVELVGADRATLSPVRFWTKEPVSSLPTRFGLPSAAKMQELTLFTFVPEKRMQVTNYKTKAMPTNLRVETDYTEPSGRTVNLKERTGEMFAALHDRFLEKNPNTFLLEYAWSTETCGRPCPTEPILPHELLSLGADVFEAALPEDVQHPEPPEATEEEKGKLDAQLEALKTPKEKADAKKVWEEDRKELARRKALLERNRYVLSRLHYRYAAAGMPNNVELGEGAPITGGVGLPEGEFGAADTSVKPSEKNEFQTRYNGLFPNKIVVKCDDPKPHRWGKPPRSYRGLNKVWVAEDLSRRDRKRIDPEKAVLTAVPDLGLSGKGSTSAPKEVAPASTDAKPAEKEGGCGCHVAGLSGSSGSALLAAGGGLLLFWRRRRST